jgi:hypothetical protein
MAALEFDGHGLISPRWPFAFALPYLGRVFLTFGRE